MKKNNFLSGVGTKLGLVVMALAGSLLSSCEKEDFKATFEAAPAEAYIAVTVYDAENPSTSVTPSSINSNVGTLKGSEIVITGARDIPAQVATVTVSYDGKTATGSVSVAQQSAGTKAHYAITFIFGKDGETITIQPTYEAAEAKITASTDFADDVEPVEVTYSFKSTVDGGRANSNVFSITGNKDIPAQTVTVTATVGEKNLVKAVEVPALKEGSIYSCNVIFLVTKEVLQEDIVETTSYEVQSKDGAPIEKTYYLTGNYNHTHDGIDQWLANDSEWWLTAKVTYDKFAGYELSNVTVTTESEFVTNLINPLRANSGITAYEETMEFKVSAWSLYAAWATVTTATTDYTVEETITKTKNGEVVSSVTSEVASYSISRRSVVANSKEIPHPDHSHAYGHDHGHGSGNAGGGIVYAD